MDKMEHSRKLAGLVHAAGSRAERIDRVQSAIERQFEEAETTLRLMREELTQPPPRAATGAPATRAPEKGVPATGAAATGVPGTGAAGQPRAAGSPQETKAGAGQRDTRPGAGGGARRNLRLAAAGRHAALFAVGCACTGVVLAVVDPDTGAWRQASGPPPQPAAEAPAKHKTAAVTRSSQSGRAPAQAAPQSAQLAMAQGAAGGREQAGPAQPERTQAPVSPRVIETPPAPPVADPSPGVIIFAPAAQTGPAQRAGAGAAPYAARFAGVNSAERQCLARSIYYEAGGEPVTAQIAVAQVVLNRAMAEDGPRTICGVVDGVGGAGGPVCQPPACGKGPPRQGGQAWVQAQKVADDLVSGESWLAELLPATHYHRHDQTPAWRHAVGEIGRIGGLVFYKPAEGAAASRTGAGGARQVPSAATGPARR